MLLCMPMEMLIDGPNLNMLIDLIRDNGDIFTARSELFIYFYIKNYIGTQGEVCTVKGF